MQNCRTSVVAVRPKKNCHFSSVSVINVLQHRRRSAAAPTKMPLIFLCSEHAYLLWTSRSRQTKLLCKRTHQSLIITLVRSSARIALQFCVSALGTLHFSSSILFLLLLSLSMMLLLPFACVWHTMLYGAHKPKTWYISIVIYIIVTICVIMPMHAYNFHSGWYIGRVAVRRT